MDHITDAFDRAVRAEQRPIPQSAGARVRFLLRSEGTRTVAQRLGVSARTVQRYATGQIKSPRADVAQRLEAAVRERWQPRVRQRALRRAAGAGVVVETRAQFGFTAAPGTTDDARQRRITQHLPPDAVGPLLDAYRAGAGEQQLRQQVAEGLGQAYFRDGGRRAHGLDVTLNEIDYLDIDLL